MKLTRWIALVCCAMPLSAYALFCPTNSQYLELGDTSDNIKKVCGAPTTINTIDNSTIISARWTYVEDADDFIKTTKFTLDDGHITKMEESIVCKTEDNGCIPVTDLDVKIYYGCSQMMYIGNNIPYVEKNCGPQAMKETLKAVYHVTEEYIYANTSMPSTLIFENGKLVDSK